MKKLFPILALIFLFVSCSNNKLSLYKACYTNNLNSVQKYYEKSSDELNKNAKLNQKEIQKLQKFFSDKHVNTSIINVYFSPFQAAILGESVEVLDYFIKNGLNINTPFTINKDSQNLQITYLIFAAKNGKEKSLKFLLENNANPEILDSNNYSILYHIITSEISNKSEIFRLLAQYNLDFNFNNQSEIEDPILFYSNKNECLYNETNDYSRMLDILIKFGIDLNAKNKAGDTILIDTIKIYNESSVNLKYIKILLSKLLKSNADFNVQGEKGYTALHCSSLNGNLEITKSLLANNVNVSIQDDLGRTPLLCAANNGNTEIVNELLKKGSYINAQDNDGNTALIGAAEILSADTIRLLLQNKANKNICNKNGYKAIQLAGARCSGVSKKEVIEELLDYKSYDTWTIPRFNVQAQKNINKKIAINSLHIGNFNSEYLTLTDDDYNYGIYAVYDNYESEPNVKIEEKLIQCMSDNRLIKFDCYGVIEDSFSHNFTNGPVLHITNIVFID